MHPKLSPNNGYRWCPLGKLSHLGMEQLRNWVRQWVGFIKTIEWFWWTRLVQIHINGIWRGRGTHSQCCTYRVRRRGCVFGWREVKAPVVLCGGLEVHAKVQRGGIRVAWYGRINDLDVDLHHEDDDGAVEDKGIYNHIYSIKEYQEKGEVGWSHT